MEYKKYENRLVYPKMPIKPGIPLPSAGAQAFRDYANVLDQYEIDKKETEVLRKAYHEEDNRLYAEFKVDALKEVGLWKHETGNRAFEFAWEHGHSSGYQAVLSNLVEIAYVVTGNR